MDFSFEIPYFNCIGANVLENFLLCSFMFMNVQIIEGKDLLNERTNIELRYLKKVRS